MFWGVVIVKMLQICNFEAIANKPNPNTNLQVHEFKQLYVLTTTMTINCNK